MGEERRSRVEGRPRRSAAGRYRGSRRAPTGSGAISRRMTIIGLAVGAVLIGTGALAATLPAEPPNLLARQPPPPRPAVSTGPAGAAAGSPAAEAPTPPAASEPVPVPSPPVPSSTAGDPTVAPTAASPSRSPMVRSFEAEEAELSGFVRIFPLADASSGAVVGMIGLHVDSHVRFPEVMIDEAGEYELTIYYVSQPGREATLVVNDGEPVTLEFPGLGNGREVGELTLPVELVVGENEIWFGNPGGPAPALDRITITG